MANKEHLEILRQGVEAWNRWRKENPGKQPDLSGADLDGANLDGADLSTADLSLARLGGADLSNADLSGAVLADANLTDVNLRFSYLSNTDLQNSYLSGAIFFRTHLRGADFTGARIRATVFADVDLSNIVGAECVIPEGPSSVGFDTVYRSRGELSDVFLRRCGLSDWEVEAAKLHNLDLSETEIVNITQELLRLRSGLSNEERDGGEPPGRVIPFREPDE